MSKLKDFASYDDPLVIFDIIPLVEEGGSLMNLTDRILVDLNQLIQAQTLKVDEARKKMDSSFGSFKTLVLITGILLIALAIAVATAKKPGYLIVLMISPDGHMAQVFPDLATLAAAQPKDKAKRNLKEVNAIVFDNTGTLTLEQFQVKKVYACDGFSEETVLMHAAIAEYRQGFEIMRSGNCGKVVMDWD